jgi:hypothetical protein
MERTRHQLAPAMPSKKTIDRAGAGAVADRLFVGRLRSWMFNISPAPAACSRRSTRRVEGNENDQEPGLRLPRPTVQQICGRAPIRDAVSIENASNPPQTPAAIDMGRSTSSISSTRITLVPPPNFRDVTAEKIGTVSGSSGRRLRGRQRSQAARESGFPDFVVVGWNALAAPAGLSVDVVRILNREVNSALAARKVIERKSGLRDHGEHPARHPVRSAEPRRRSGDLVEGTAPTLQIYPDRSDRTNDARA